MEPRPSSTSSTNLQKKMLTYARDVAFDKLSKKLDKKIAKKQLRKNDHENVSYQRCSQSTDYITSSSEIPSASSSDISPVSQSSDSFAGSTIESGNNVDARNLSNKNVIGVEPSSASTASINSSGQEDDFETADEDDEQVPMKKDTLQTKPSELNEIQKTKDFVVEIPDDKNDKSIVKSTLPEGHPPTTPHHHHSAGSSVDYSGYIQKKSLAQGMMDLALVSANTNQLRYIIEYKEHHPYFMTSLSLVIASLFLQLAVGMTLIWNTRFNVKKRKEMQEADKVNNFSVIGIFIVTLINVFLSTFGGAPQSGGSKPETVALADEVESPVDDPITLQ